jgi:Concanavalin A-like lectin/glucanases superfamily
VDRGSEFSLLADEKGSSELFVHEGTVEGSYRGGNGTARTPWMMNAKEARRFSKLGATDIQDRERKWGKLQRLAQVVPQRNVSTMSWSFDGGDRNLFAADGVSGEERSAAPGSGSSPNHFSSVDGRRNSAVRIKSGGSLAVPLAELSVAKPRTLSFWVRAQPLSSNRSETLLAEWLVPAGSGGLKPLRVSLNDGLEHGSRGALRMDLGRFSVLSASPVDDGKWHHVAWVFVVGEGGPPLQYLDGRLENATPRAAAAKPRRIARPDKASLFDGRLVLGGGAQLDIDELQYTDGALAPQEIGQLANPSR